MDTALVQPKSVCDEALGILSGSDAQNAFARDGSYGLIGDHGRAHSASPVGKPRGGEHGYRPGHSGI